MKKNPKLYLRYEWQLENEVVAELVWEQKFNPTDLDIMYESAADTANTEDSYDQFITIVSFRMYR